MARWTWLLLILIVAVIVWRRLARQRAGQQVTPTSQPDQLVLEHLRKAGSDLTQPHRPEFFLYLPNEPAARAVAQRFQQEGFGSDVSLAPERTDWACVLTKPMVLTLSELTQLRKEFNEVAGAYGGEYDGWGTEVVK